MGRQLQLNVFKGKRGGRRPGSGRKRIHSRGVAHRTREVVTGRTPLHINFKFRKTIRNKHALKLLKRALLKARSQGLCVIHFSLQSNHIHLIVEAQSNQILTKGMRSLTVTFAKGLHLGRIQVGRYHLHVLKSIQETRHAVRYVLFNKQKHEKGTYSVIDGYSSLLTLADPRKIIRSFAIKSKMTLKIGVNDCWRGDQEKSFLLKRALSTLYPSS